MHHTHHRIEYPVESWSSFDCVDSFGSFGRAVIDSTVDRITGPIVFMAEIALKGLKIAINEVKN